MVVDLKWEIVDEPFKKIKKDVDTLFLKKYKNFIELTTKSSSN